MIPLFFELISSPSENVQRLSMWALTYLGQDQQPADAKELVTRLQKSSLADCEKAAIEMAFVSFTDDDQGSARIALAEAGALPKLIEMLHSDSTQRVKLAALVLAYFTNGCTSCFEAC